MNDEIPTGIDAVDKILSNKFRKSADLSSPTFSKQIRDTGNLILRKESNETRKSLPSQKAKSPWLKKAQREQDEADEAYADKVIKSTENRNRILELGQKVNAGTISDAERAELYQGIPEEENIPELSSDGFRVSSPNDEEDIQFTSDGFRASTEKPSKKKSANKRSSDKTWNEKWKEDNPIADKAFDTLADGAKAFGKMAKKKLQGLKSEEKGVEIKEAETKQTIPSSSATNPDSILAEAASTNPYGIYARREYNESTGRHEIHIYKRDGKRITHADAEYLLTLTQIKTLKHYAEYNYAGKIPSNKRRTLLSSSSNPNFSTPTTGASTNTGTSTNGNTKYTKWQTTRPNRTKDGLVGSPKLRQLAQARQATGLTQQPATTALAGKRDASGSIGGQKTRRDAFGSVTGQVTGRDAYGSIAGVNRNGVGTTKRDASGSIIGTTNRNFIGVNNENTPRLNAPRNAEGSIAGASGNSIGYDAVRTINNPNRTRPAHPSGLVTRNRATQRPVTAAQGAVNLSHVVTPSAAHRQAVAQEQMQAQELQFNAGTRNPTKSGINKAREASPSRIVRNNKTTGEVNTTRQATKAGIKPSRQKSPSRIVRKPAQVTKSAINKAKSAHYSKIVTRAIKDAGLVEVAVGKDTILVDEKELTKSGLKTKSRKKRPSAIRQSAKNASPS